MSQLVQYREAAEGLGRYVAALELLVSFKQGRYLEGNWPWLREDVFDRHVIDWKVMAETHPGLENVSYADGQVLDIAVSLVERDHKISLFETLAYLDGNTAILVLRSMAQAMSPTPTPSRDRDLDMDPHAGMDTDHDTGYGL